MTTSFNLQEGIEMIMTGESGVEGNESEYNDSECDSYSSDDGDNSGESEGSSADIVDGALAEGDENRQPWGTGRSHVIEEKKEKVSYLAYTIYFLLYILIY